jgi:hypothetical protein
MEPRCVPSTAGHRGRIKCYFDFRDAKPKGRRKIVLDSSEAVPRLVVGFACFEVHKSGVAAPTEGRGPISAWRKAGGVT